MTEFSEKTTRVLVVVAGVFLLAMMMVSIVDVVFRYFLRAPFPGAVELVELCLVMTIFVAIPGSFLRREHLVVDLVDVFASPRTVSILRCFGECLSLVFLLVAGFQMVNAFRDTVAFRDKTMVLDIPKYIHWLPILAGTAASVLGLAAFIARDVAGACREKGKS